MIRIYIIYHINGGGFMKKIALATAALLSISAAHAYQAELQGNIGYYDAELNDGNYNAGLKGTYYTKKLDTSKGPLAEAAFLNQATSVSMAYSYGKLNADVNLADTFKQKADAQKAKYPSADPTIIDKKVAETAAALGLDSNFKAELDTEQHSYGVKAETYMPTAWVPVYASASYNHSKTDARNAFTANQFDDDSGDRYALEVGAMLAPNFLVAVGYTSVASNESLDAFNIVDNGLMLATMESRTIGKDQDAVTVRTKYVGAIDGTNMALGFETGLVYGEEFMSHVKTDLYLTPKFSVGASFAKADYTSASVPTSATGIDINYFITPSIQLGVNYVYANGKNSAKDAQLGGVEAKFRF